MWATQGAIINPADATLLADTGPLLAALSSLTIMLSSTVGGGVVRLNRRNALNDTTLQSHPIMIGGLSHLIFSFGITLLLNERITLTRPSGFTGTIEGSIII